VCAEDATVVFGVSSRLHGAIDDGLYPRLVVRVDGLQICELAWRHISGGDAPNLVELVRPGDLVGGDVPLPAAEVREGLGLAQLRRGLSQLLVCGFSAGEPRRG